MRKFISESPTVAVLCDPETHIQNISWFRVGDGIGRLNRKKLATQRQAEKLGTIHSDIATLAMLGYPITEMVPLLGKDYRDLQLSAGQLQAAFDYPEKVLTRRLFQQGLVDVAQRPEPLDLTDYDKQYLSYLLDGKPKKEIQKIFKLTGYEFQKHFNELRERTQWLDEHQVALAGLMNGQLTISGATNYYTPQTKQPPVEPQLLEVAEELRQAPLPSEIWYANLPTPLPAPPTVEEIRHRYMDDPRVC